MSSFPSPTFSNPGDAPTLHIVAVPPSCTSFAYAFACVIIDLLVV